MAQPEYERVERPLVDQLTAMGWTHLSGADPGHPATDAARSGRRSFTQTLYPDRFRMAVSRLNLGADGQPWLSTGQLDHLQLLLTGSGNGVNGNLEVTRHLREGVNARTLPGWRSGDPEHVRLVDWDGEYGGNDLLVVSQFRVERRDLPAVTPDLVLFVNGLPWAVVECKAFGAAGRFTLDEAIDQVIGYAGARSQRAVPDFVRFVQVLVATDRESAELGTITAEPEHFAPWRSVEPATETAVRAETGTPQPHPLTAQAVLVAGVLRPNHLLHLVRDFTTHAGAGSGAIKVFGRYPQFRAVKRLTRQLEARQRAVMSGHDADPRGGIVWHTQGSGKSLTMAFLVRHLRSSGGLAGHKVVVVTDRIDLEKQIRRSLGAAGEDVHRARTVREARQYLEVDVPDLVLVTIQKAQRDDAASDSTEESLGEQPEEERHLHNRVANSSADIVVLIDEAHRSHNSWQHARLRAMLPNAVVIGFTGTPVISGARKPTREIFGEFADTYTLRDAEQDGAVVPVRYEAHHVPLEVIERAVLDLRFDEEVPPDAEQRQRVLRRFARRKEILESPGVIAAKARHMMRHWAKHAMPDHFGAQIVTVSRQAAVEYRRALLTARDELVAELDAFGPEVLHDPMADAYLTDEQRELLYLLPHRKLLSAVDVAVVISEVQGKRDPADWRRWTLKSRQEDHIERFKKGIGGFAGGLSADPSWQAETHGPPATAGSTAPGTAGDPWHEGRNASPPPGQAEGESEEHSEPLAFLVVKSMLLTGFDAPVEQVMYLDRAIAGVELLQAIARTNRPFTAKRWGQVVDYIGIGPDLASALAAYDREHLRKVLGYQEPSADHLQPDYQGRQPADDRPWLQTDAAADKLLRDLRERLDSFLRGSRVGLEGAGALREETAREDLLAALVDPSLRGEFDELARDFLTALNAVLPRPQALAHEALARQLGEVQYLVRRRYLDGREQFSPRRYGAKVRRLIAQHLAAGGISERVPPVEISAPDFMVRVNANPDARVRTSYMRGRLRLHIDARLSSDPRLYERFSVKLEEIARRMEQDFEAAASSLEDLIGEVRDADTGAGAGEGLDPYTEGPVHRLLQHALEEAGQVPTPPGIDLFQASSELCVMLAERVRLPHFEQLSASRERLRRELRQRLETLLAMDWETTGDLAGELVELAAARRADFARYTEDPEQR